MLRFVVLDGLAKPARLENPDLALVETAYTARRRERALELTVTAETAARRAALRALLPAAGVDALLVTDLVNIRYLTGFTGSNAALLVHVDGDTASRLCTDGRYRAQVAAEVPDLEPVIDRACAVTLAGRAHGLGVRRLGFESDARHGRRARRPRGEGACGHAGPRARAGPAAADGQGRGRAGRAAHRLRDRRRGARRADRRRRPRTRPHRARRRAGPGVPHAGPRCGRAVVPDDRRGGPHSAVPHHSPTAEPLRPGALVPSSTSARSSTATTPT